MSDTTRTHREASDKSSVDNAVYGYIRAIRALGRTETNAAEVAQALSIPISQVNSAFASLKAKGVKTF